MKTDSGDARLEGEEHHFRFIQVTHVETNAKNASSNILVVGEPGCLTWLVV